MNDQSKTSVADVQRKLRSARSLCLDVLLPQVEVFMICDELGHQYRDRVYNPMNVVWMFVTHVLSADHSSQQAVARLNAWRVILGLAKVSSKTTSYCKARCRLPEALFERLLTWTSVRSEQASSEAWLLHDRIVEMVDGSTVDSVENQEKYPQMARQKPSCGFPIARMIGLFSLVTGAINHTALGP